MEKFYNKYHISKSHFAKLIGMDVKTLDKYENDEKLKPETVARIEDAKELIIDNDIVFPRYIHFMDEIDMVIYKNKLAEADGLFKILRMIGA